LELDVDRAQALELDLDRAQALEVHLDLEDPAQVLVSRRAIREMAKRWEMRPRALPTVRGLACSDSLPASPEGLLTVSPARPQPALPLVRTVMLPVG